MSMTMLCIGLNNSNGKVIPSYKCDRWMNASSTIYFTNPFNLTPRRNQCLGYDWAFLQVVGIGVIAKL